MQAAFLNDLQNGTTGFVPKHSQSSHQPVPQVHQLPRSRGLACGRQLLRCLFLPAVSTPCHACTGERTALSCRPRRLRQQLAPWSGGSDLSAESHHCRVENRAYHRASGKGLWKRVVERGSGKTPFHGGSGKGSALAAPSFSSADRAIFIAHRAA